MKIQLCNLLLLIFVFSAVNTNAEMVAKVTTIEGIVQIMKNGTTDYKSARPGMPLEIGDQLYTQEESFAELRYNIGTVLRMDEKTKITLEVSTEKTIKSKSTIGSVWINMRKLISTGKEFEVSTPTAVAAIRGTVYTMSTTEDSTSEVSVYQGKVAVGPADDLKKKMESGKKKIVTAEQPTEVLGPDEIPGPFEVSLDSWKTIVAGQKIAVRKDGKYSQGKFDPAGMPHGNFAKKNITLDELLMKEKTE